jgi:CheY-like chemotaxis protein
VLTEFTPGFFSEEGLMPRWPFFFSFATPGGKQASVQDKPTRVREATRDHPLRVLLVEDHKDTLRALRNLLVRLGHEVLSAENMTDALRVSEEEEFDLLLSDIGLPDGSGLELVRRIRETRRINAIAVSGFGMEDDVLKSREAGFFDHLTKPVSFDRLQEAIQQVGSQ